jgi:hypothetical protein
MDPLQQVNAEHYRAVARRIRREAASVKDAAIRSQLLEIATTYEKLRRASKSNVKSRRAMPIFQNVRLYDFDGGPAKVQNHNM